MAEDEASTSCQACESSCHSNTDGGHPTSDCSRCDSSSTISRAAKRVRPDLTQTCSLAQSRAARTRKQPDSNAASPGFCRVSSRCPATLLLSLAIVALTLTLPGSWAQFVTVPQLRPYYVKDGVSLTLDCSVEASYLSSSQRYELQWLKIVQGTPIVVTRASKNLLGAHYELDENSSKGAYNLRITSISYKEDNGEFFCQLTDNETPNGFYSKKAVVVVLVPPGAPEIASQPGPLAKEGERVETTCRSAGGNPPPSVRWRWQNGTLTPASWTQTTNATSKDLPTVSTLKWTVTADEHLTTLDCQVWNRAMSDEDHWLTTTTSVLNVQFKPMVTLQPSSSYNVEEGTDAKIVCSARANPEPAKYQWEQTSGQAVGLPRRLDSNAGVARFRADKSHQGDFSCSVTNLVGTGRASLAVNVLYGPQIIVPEELVVDVGKPIYLSCNVSANPMANIISWTGPNGVASGGAVLEITSVTKEHAGNYTCEAENEISVTRLTNNIGDPVGVNTEKRKNSRQTVLKVRYAPGTGRISVSKSPVVERDTVQLTCATDEPGFPAAQYKWQTPNDHGYNTVDTNPLTLPTVSMGVAGEYKCLPYNAVDDGIAGTFYLEVIQPPSWEKYLDDQDLMVNEGQTVIDRECVAKGNPLPDIRWYKNGHLLVSGKHFKISNTEVPSQCPDPKKCSRIRSSRLHWQGAARWNDSGEYGCEATNQHDVTPIRAFQKISVIHRPVVVNARYGANRRALAAATKGQAARITCIVSSRPAPTFRWYFEAQAIDQVGRHYSFEEDSRATSGTSSNQDGTRRHTLVIHNPQDDDFGLYNCTATNHLGADSVLFQLKQKSTPLTPTGLRMISTTYNSITIAWKPGFDGGSKQAFMLEITKTNPLNGDLYEVAPEVVTNDRVDPTVIGPLAGRRVKRYVYTATEMELKNLTELFPFTTYSFRVRSKNTLGTSEWTEFSSATTDDVPTDPLIQRPLGATYDPDTKKLTYKEMQTPADAAHCLMVYVRRSAAEQWRAWSCLKTQNGTAANVPDLPLRVRYCREHQPTASSAAGGGEPASCSEAELVVRTSAVKPSILKVLVPILVVVAAVLLVSCVVLLCCCMRRQKQPADYNKTANNAAGFDHGDGQHRHRVSTLPGTNEKPPMGNGHQQPTATGLGGSVADSGVFTMGSQYPHPPTEGLGYSNGGMRSSYDTGADRWGSAADPFGDYGNDPYNNGHGYDFGGEQAATLGGYQSPPPTQPQGYDYYDQYGNRISALELAYQPGVQTVADDRAADSRSVSSNYSAGGGGGNRRVMREIIV